MFSSAPGRLLGPLGVLSGRQRVDRNIDRKPLWFLSIFRFIFGRSPGAFSGLPGGSLGRSLGLLGCSQVPFLGSFALPGLPRRLSTLVDSCRMAPAPLGLPVALLGSLVGALGAPQGGPLLVLGVQSEL